MRLKRADLALACANRIPGRGCSPPALLTRAVNTDDVDAVEDIDTDSDDEGYIEYHRQR